MNLGKKWALVLLFASVFPALAFSGTAPLAGPAIAETPELAFESNPNFIIIFKPEIDQSLAIEELESNGLELVYLSPKNNMAVVREPSNAQFAAYGVMVSSEEQAPSAEEIRDSISEYAEKVSEGKLYYPLLAESVPMISAPEAWALGYNGSDASVCIIDTGIDYFSTQLPTNFVAKDFTTDDWYIDGPVKSTGWVHKYKINISSSLDWVQMGVWWGLPENRFDISVYYPNGTLAADSASMPRTSNSDGYYAKFNISINNLTGIYDVFVNYTNSSGSDYPTLFWGTQIMDMPFYWSLEASPLSNDSRAFYNIHPHDDQDISHGTHVAGTVAKQTEPKGVAPGVKLYVAKVFSSTGGAWDSDIIQAIDWCVAENADIISMSLGGADTDNCADPVATAVSNYADQALFIIAAGNSGSSSSTIQSPGCAKSALTVGAVSKSRSIASFSSRGPSEEGAFKPEVSAPGVSISSTIVPDTIGSMSGTSMATPHVSGLAAIIKQKYPSLSPQELKAVIIAGTERTACDYNYGCGIINATRSLGMKTLEGTVSYGSPVSFSIQASDSPLNFLLYSNDPADSFNSLSLSAFDGSTEYSGVDNAWSVKRIANLSAISNSAWNVTISAPSGVSLAEFVLAYPNSSVLERNISLSLAASESWSRSSSGPKITYDISYSGPSGAICTLYNPDGSMLSQTQISSSGTNIFSLPSRVAQGAYNYSVFCSLNNDESVNSTASFMRYYDKGKPAITTFFPQSSGNSTDVELNYSSSDALSPNVSCILSSAGQTYPANLLSGENRTETVTFSKLKNTVKIKCTDFAGNSATISRKVTVDSIPPQVTVRSALPSRLLNLNMTRNVAVSYSIRDSDSTMNSIGYQILNSTLDEVASGALGTRKSGKFTVALPGGSYSVGVWAIDLAQNYGVSASRSFTVQP